MESQRITATTLITLLTAATTSFALNFLALFSTPLALAQSLTDITPEDTNQMIRNVNEQRREFERIHEKVNEQRREFERIHEKVNEQRREKHQERQERQERQKRTRELQEQQWWLQQEQQKRLSRSLGDADKFLHEGVQQFKTNQFQAALTSWQKALQLKELGLQTLRISSFDPKLEKEKKGIIIYNLGVVYARLGQYPVALEFYQKALGIAKEKSDKAWEGAILNGFGKAYSSLGRYPEALKYYQQALDIFKAVHSSDISEQGRVDGDNVGRRTTFNSIKADYIDQAQYSFYQMVYGSHINIFEQGGVYGDNVGEGATLKGLGEVYYTLGEYDQALKYYQQALDIQIDKAAKGVIFNGLGKAYSSLGRYPEALKYYQQALDIFKAAYSSDIFKKGRVDGDNVGEGTTLNSIGGVYKDLAQYPEALKYYQQALDIFKQVGNKVGEGTTLNNIAAAYTSLERYTEALKYYQQALDIFKQAGYKIGEGTTLTSIGAVYNSLGQYSNAERTLFASIGVLESLRSGLTDADKVLISNIPADTYRLLQQALIAQKKIDTALEVAEQSRARAFVELLGTRLSSQPTIQSPFAPTAPPTFERILQIAKTQRATLVEYSITYNKVQGKEKLYPELYIWVVKPTGEVVFRQVNLNVDTNLAAVAEEARVSAASGRNRAVAQQEAILANLVRGTRDSVNQESSNTTTNSAPGKATSSLQINNRHLQQMHQLLIQPITDLLPSDPEARVIFIPQGSLFLIPFPALQDANGKYLIEKHTILTAPAIQVLELNRQQWLRALGKDMLVVGNPTMPNISSTIGEPPQQLAPLPGAEQEAIAVASLLNTRAITGNQATKTAILQQMPKARIIHLATHGFLDDFTGGGVPGAIALAPSGKDNGLLTANEILNLKLNAELVVFSACDTGRGRITGDGVIGLSRSLISAGVPSVVVSLWKVPDEPTAALMTEFYRRWQRNPNKAAALRQAMLTTMKTHSNPRDWAAFTLIGEAR